jgi:hypothetical protein
MKLILNNEGFPLAREKVLFNQFLEKWKTKRSLGIKT